MNGRPSPAATAILLVVLAVVAACTTGVSSSAGSPTPTAGGSPGPASSTKGSPSPSAAPSGGSVELVVLAAASLKGVLEEAVGAYEAATPGVSLVVSTDSSAALATQIEQGAPADLFLSADTSNPQRLADQGLAIGKPVVFARNRLTIIVPSGDPGGVRTPADLARPGLRIVAAGDAVPITAYADQLVAALARQPGYPSGFEAAYAANVVSREDNVKAVVAKVELGEGDAAIVYSTDARASSKVETIEVPTAADVIASDAGIVVGASEHREAAAAFLAWLAGPDGQAILAAAGFLPPS